MSGRNTRGNRRLNPDRDEAHYRRVVDKASERLFWGTPTRDIEEISAVANAIAVSDLPDAWKFVSRIMERYKFSGTEESRAFLHQLQEEIRPYPSVSDAIDVVLRDGQHVRPGYMHAAVPANALLFLLSRPESTAAVRDAIGTYMECLDIIRLSSVPNNYGIGVSQGLQRVLEEAA